MTNKQKQNLLQYLGYYTGIPDGIWGPMSQQATEAFQLDFGGISVDGICGEQTEKALKHAVAYGIEKKSDSTDYTNVQNNSTDDSTNNNTGTFWDEIKYFTRDEPGIACPCGRCGGFPVEPTEKLMQLADKVRGLAGAPANPSSTVRCPAHNAELKGSSPTSRHMSGKAMDFCIAGWSSAKTLALVKQQPEVRYTYAIDESYVHMDVE